MLYFSEVDWTLPDMQTVSLEFERNYDQNEYEQKISMLVRKVTARRHPENEGEIDSWNEALLKLSAGDHYLTVLSKVASESSEPGHGFIPTLAPPPTRPLHDRFKLWATAFALVFGGLAAMLLYSWIRSM